VTAGVAMRKAEMTDTTPVTSPLARQMHAPPFLYFIWLAISVLN
jgi:hypothetical protein